MLRKQTNQKQLGTRLVNGNDLLLNLGGRISTFLKEACRILGFTNVIQVEEESVIYLWIGKSNDVRQSMSFSSSSILMGHFHFSIDL